MIKKIVRIVILILALAILVYFGARYIQDNRGKAEEGGIEKSAATGNEVETEAAVPVRVIELKRGDLPLRLSLTAETEARERALVKNEVGGVVNRIFRHEGDLVAAGEPVIQLESREIELTLRQAEAGRLEAYSKFLSQYNVLVAGDGTKASAMGEKKRQYEEALKKFKKGQISKDEMEKTEDLLLAGMIESGTLQDEVKRCVTGLTTSEVIALSPEIDREKKTGTVFIRFSNPGNVRSGLNAEVDIEYAIVKDVLKIPRQSMLVGSNRTLVFTMENDIALWKYLEAGSGNDEEIEVKSGELQAGDRVVIEGQLTLAHQAKVKIIE